MPNQIKPDGQTPLQVLQRWWERLPDSTDAIPIDCRKLSWLALNCYEVGWAPAARERWLSVPVSFWQQVFGSTESNMVLVYCVRYGGATGRSVTVLGLLSMMHKQPLPTARNALINQYWTRHDQLQCPQQSAAPPLVAPTLEAVHRHPQLRARLLDSCVMDVTREVQLCSRTLSLLVELARLGASGDRHHSLVQDAERILLRQFNLIADLRSVEGQITQAKMRFYARLAVIGMPYSDQDDQNNRPLQMALNALWLWNAALMWILCPSEHHVVEAIDEFQLPLSVEPLKTADILLLRTTIRALPQAGQWPLLYVQNKQADAATVNLIRDRYVPRKALSSINNKEIVMKSGRMALVYALQCGGSTEWRWRYRIDNDVSSQDQERDRPATDPTLPISFCCAVAPQSDRQELVRRLCWFLGNDSLWAQYTLVLPSSDTHLSVDLLPLPNGDQFFTIQELVFANTAELALFLEQWGGRCHLQCRLPLDDGDERPATYIPHMPLGVTPPLSQRMGAPISALLAATSNPILIDNIMMTTPAACAAPAVAIVPRGHPPFVWPYFGHWLATRVVREIVYTRNRVATRYNQHPKRYMQQELSDGLKSVFSNVMRQLGAPLYSSLQGACMAASAAPTGSMVGVGLDLGGRSVLTSRQYKHLEYKIGAPPSRLEAFFRHLADSGGRVRVSANGNEVSSGKLKLNLRGKYHLCWRAWDGTGRGHSLLSLIRYVRTSLDDHAALLLMEQWATANIGAEELAAPIPVDSAAGTSSLASSTSSLASSTDSLAQQLSEQRRLDEELTTIRVGLRRLHSRTLPLSDAGASDACRYLRESRGLRDSAPRSLIEDNLALRFAPSHFASEDGQRHPALLVFTAQWSAAQQIYLSHPLTSDTADPAPIKSQLLKVQKKTMGKLTIGHRLRDIVCVQQPAGATATKSLPLFISEGMETALSVACAIEGAGVYAALGVQNIEMFSVGVVGNGATTTVVWCCENDPPSTSKEMQDAAAQRTKRTLLSLRQRYRCVLQWFPPSQYKDFNDIHQQLPGRAGTQLIRKSYQQLAKQNKL